MIRLSIVGLDGHGPVFAHEINSNPYWRDRMRVTCAMPLKSPFIAEKKLKENIREAASLEIETTDSPGKLVKNSDCILILQDDPNERKKLIEIFAHYGKPLFIDKPFAPNLDDALRMVRLLQNADCPFFSSSCIRYTPEMEELKKMTYRENILSVLTYSPYMENYGISGWLYYGIHAIDPLFAIMGSGWQTVKRIPGEFALMAIGEWGCGRTGIAKAVYGGKHEYGYCVWTKNENIFRKIKIDGIYNGLFSKIENFALTAAPPVQSNETLEIMAFIDAVGGNARP